jgi:hypothetical protein
MSPFSRICGLSVREENECQPERICVDDEAFASSSSYKVISMAALNRRPTACIRSNTQVAETNRRTADCLRTGSEMARTKRAKWLWCRLKASP